jgi:RNA polymerase sigma-70 factor (ECF subfamily)
MARKEEKLDDRTLNLVSKAVEGDAAAVSELYTMYQSRLEAAVRAGLGERLRSRMETLDLIQSVWKDVLPGIKDFQYHDSDSFFRWLAARIIRKIQDKGRYFAAEKRDLKKEKRIRSENDASIGVLPPPSSEPPPSRAAILSEQMERLMRLMNLLPEAQRRIIVMRRRDELEFEEIGERLSKSVHAVRKLYERGMQRLNELVQGERGGRGEGE